MGGVCDGGSDACTDACGKEDKLVLVTTEAAASQSDATTTEDILADIREEAENTTEEEKKREPASEEDKKVTMEAIYDANKGDTLLAGGNNYSLNTIYYSDGVEVYSVISVPWVCRGRHVSAGVRGFKWNRAGA